MLSNRIFLIMGRSAGGFRKAHGLGVKKRPRELRAGAIRPAAGADLSQASGLNVRRETHPCRDDVIFLLHIPHNPVIAVLQHIYESRTDEESLVPVVLKSPRVIPKYHKGVENAETQAQ